MKTIVLGGGKQIPLPIYVAGIKTAKAHPNTTFTHGLTGWWPVTGKEVVRQFLDGVHDRINLRGGVVVLPVKMERYHERQRENATCAWCGGEIPKGRFNPNVKHNFCSDDCCRAYNIW